VGTTSVAVALGGTSVEVGVVTTVIVRLTVAVGAGVAVSRVAGGRLGGKSTSGLSAIAILVDTTGSRRCILGISVAEAVAVAVGEAGVVGVDSGLVTASVAGIAIGAMLHGLLMVAVIC